MVPKGRDNDLSGPRERGKVLQGTNPTSSPTKLEAEPDQGGKVCWGGEGKDSS